MSLKWEILLAVIRLLFVVAPFMSIGKEFGLIGTTLDKAKEFANAGNGRAILVTFPIELFVRTLAEADNRGATCQKNLFMIAVYVVIVVLLAYMLYKTPTDLFRTWFLPFVWFFVITILSLLATSYRLSLLANPLCR